MGKSITEFSSVTRVGLDLRWIYGDTSIITIIPEPRTATSLPVGKVNTARAVASHFALHLILSVGSLELAFSPGPEMENPSRS